MEWTKEEIERYSNFFQKAMEYTSWNSMIHGMAEGWEVRDPTSAESIGKAEVSLKIGIPEELRHLLLETSGIVDDTGCNVVWSLDQIVEANAQYRSNADFGAMYMPFDHLLLFGEAGNGDLFAYSITRDGQVVNKDVFGWSHETDDRKWLAKSIKDLVVRRIAGLVYDAS
jgi:hypothetical protein